MKENSPKDNWFYLLEELENRGKQADLKIVKKVEFCPFFGIGVLQKKF
ncbi:MAG TPA: hypothetical protein PLG34_00080 [Spirochaetota bacterium]|jgi:hypothetical protein|nr:hypothetical protein [Spirochaetota bacterium]HPY86365.1 hypothetical protein [Spirochaetota bacterium]HQB61941.1 hypothetical protein [Spirochaetota bacterium]